MVDRTRLEAAGFAVMAAQNPRFLLVSRVPLACLVDQATGQIGASMRLTAAGLATLTTVNGVPAFQARGRSEAATEVEIAEQRAFEREVTAALA